MTLRLTDENELLDAIKQAKTPDEMAEAMQNYAQSVEKRVLKEAQLATLALEDERVIQGRGIRRLTSKEKEFYANMAEAMRSSNPMQKLTDLNVVLPETIISSVFEDLKSEHKLLEYIEFQASNARIEFIYNADGIELAAWGELTDKFKKELSSGFKKEDLGFAKLSAFIPVSKSMLDLGPEWLDRYVRTILGEAIFEGLENGIINGNGKDQPVGMIKDLKKPINPTTGYADKDAVTFKAFTPEAYAPILKTLSTSPRVDDQNVARTRVVNKVLLIVNPEDYLTKIFPATTIKTVLGTYVNDVFPFPTEIIQSSSMPKNKAIMGLENKYFLGIGTDRSGKVAFSDDVKFLDDERVYATKLYGNGKAKDNNAFVLLNITKIDPVIPKVETVKTE